MASAPGIPLWFRASGLEGSVAEPPVDDFHDDGDRGDDGRWVTLARFWSNVEAHLARAALEREDIDCVLFDEHVVATMGWYAGGVGGIKLQVRLCDVEAARRILVHVLDRPASITRCCGRCGSDDLELIDYPGLRGLLDRLSGGLVVAMFGHPVRCKKCGQVVRVR
jgi:hypothetical protein